MNGLIENSGVKTDISAASASKTGTFTTALPTGQTANLIQFTISLFQDMQSGSHTTSIGTWNVKMDIPNQVIMANKVYGVNNGDETESSLKVPGGADLADCVSSAAESFGSSVLSVSDSGFSRVNSIVQDGDNIEVNYTLNSSNSLRKGGIAISPIVVLS